MKKRTNFLICLCLLALVAVGFAIRTKKEAPKSTPKPKVAKTPWSLVSGGLDGNHLTCSHSGYDNELDYYNSLPESSSERYFLRGLGYISREQWDRAEENLQEAHALSPEDIPTLFHLAEVQFETERYEQASQTLAQVIELRPNYYQAYGELSVCQQRLGLSEESRKNWNIYRQVIPRTEYEFNHLAALLRERGRYKESWQAASDGLKVSPNLSPLNANRAKAMIALDLKEAARVDLMIAIEDGPQWVSYYRSRIEASGEDAAQIKFDEEMIAQLQSEVLP